MLPDMSYHDAFALDTRSLESLRERAADDPRAALRESARQFEALFVQLMLKTMREALPEGGLFDSSAGRMYESLMDQQWSQHLAGRGIGLAERLADELERQLPAAE